MGGGVSMIDGLKRRLASCPGTETHGLMWCGVRTETPAMLHVLEMVQRIADLDLPVLIYGETGTGKELIARALHHASRRNTRSMVSVNCGALPESLAESELFGHERGAFTGAERSAMGHVEAAAEGTLFLDEVSSLPAAIQPKLLRFLEHGEISRVGRPRPTVVKVRVVSACNVEPGRLVADGRLRRDVFERLNGLRVDLPPLRERMQDIPLLVGQFFEEDALARQLGVTRVEDDVLAELMGHDWPGNVRELWNLLRRSLIFGARNGTIVKLDRQSPTPATTVPLAGAECPRLPRYRAWMREREREYLLELLRRHRWASERADVAGLPERTLSRKLQSMGLSSCRLRGESPLVNEVAVFDCATRTGEQVILDAERFSTRHPLLPG